MSVTLCLDKTSSHSAGCPNTSRDVDRGKRICLDSFSKEQDSSFPPILNHFILVLFFFFHFFSPFFQKAPIQMALRAACAVQLFPVEQPSAGSRWWGSLATVAAVTSLLQGLHNALGTPGMDGNDVHRRYSWGHYTPREEPGSQRSRKFLSFISAEFNSLKHF